MPEILPSTTVHTVLWGGLRHRFAASASRVGLLALEVLAAERDAWRGQIARVNWFDIEQVRYAAAISVWVRWFVWAAAVVEIVYRTPPSATEYVALLLILGTFNGFLHYMVIRKRPIGLNHILGMNALDIAAITGGVIVHGGFASFLFLAYYPAIATLALLGSSTLALIGGTVVAVMYVAVCLFVGSGIDLDARDEKELFWRIVAMYASVVAVTMIMQFERIRRRDAVERERTLHRERVELSQTIHDTAAQAAYMIGLGLDTAMEQADDSNRELAATLAATSALAKSTMWEIRRPIDLGPIFEGRPLSRVLRSQLATFTTITSVPAEMVQSGDEPALTAVTRTGLFSITHNALANAFRHARATRVQVELDYGPERIRLSISDDGVGLPDDYAERGRGFSGMRADAERMGSMLVVGTGEHQRGTSVTCIIPLPERREGD